MATVDPEKPVRYATQNTHPGLRIRITLVRIRILLLTSMPIRIRIQIVTSMQIRILLLKKVIGICDHCSIHPQGLPFDPPGLHFDPPGLHFIVHGPQRLYLGPIASEFVFFNANPDPGFHSNLSLNHVNNNIPEPMREMYR
jgi:hypothetical protein